MTTDTTPRCPAAHPNDPRPCQGPADAVRLVDQYEAELFGCVLHGATLLASIHTAHVYPGPGSHGYTDPITGMRGSAAIAAHRAARHMTARDMTLPKHLTTNVRSLAEFHAPPRNTQHVTPAELRDLAAFAARLASDVRAIRDRLATADEAIRRTGYRLSETPAKIHSAHADLLATAHALGVVLARGPDSCPILWGCCPAHGNTLLATRGGSSCQSPGCDRSWPYNRSRLPCTELATDTVRDAMGHESRMCSGHAADAHQILIGATVTPAANVP